ncbi:MAG: hypothetical protein NVS3B21_18990 [Acidimicrobiales bacterium]
MAVTDTLKDAAYVTIGLGVLGFQKAQVRRNELQKQIQTQVKSLETQVKGLDVSVPEVRRSFADLAQQVEGYVAPVRSQIDSQIDAIEASLPPQVQEFVKQARAAIADNEASLRSHLGLVTA